MERYQSKLFRYRVDHVDHDRLWQISNSQSGQDLFVIAVTQGQRNLKFLDIGAGHPIGGNNTFLLEKQFGWTGTAIDLYDYTRGNDMSSCQWFTENWKEFYLAIKAPQWPDDPGTGIDDLPEFIQNELRQIHRYDIFEGTYLGTCGSWASLRPNCNFIQANVFDHQEFLSYYDFVQFDIDPAPDSLRIAEKLLPIMECGVITFEHDVWRNMDENYVVRNRSRELFLDHGYELIVNDVTFLPPEKTRHDPDPINYEDWWVNPKVIDKKVIEAYRWIEHSGRPKFFDEILFTP